MSLPIKRDDGGSTSMMDRLKASALQQRKSSRGEAVVLLTDASGSMKTEDCDGLSRIGVACRAAHRFIMSCDPAISMVGSAVFSSRITGYAEPSVNYSPALAVLFNARPVGNTFLYSAIIWLCEQLREYKVKVRRIIALTDGWSNEYHTTIEQAIEAAKVANVVIDAIAFGDGADLDVLRRLSAETGGVLRDSRLQLESLVRTYQQLEVRIRGLLTDERRQ